MTATGGPHDQCRTRSRVRGARPALLEVRRLALVAREPRTSCRVSPRPRGHLRGLQEAVDCRARLPYASASVVEAMTAASIPPENSRHDVDRWFCPKCGERGSFSQECACTRSAASVRGVREGQIWNDRGTLCTVVSVGGDGSAVVKLGTGERLPVRAGFFARAVLVAGPP